MLEAAEFVFACVLVFGFGRLVLVVCLLWRLCGGGLECFGLLLLGLRFIAALWDFVAT